MVEWQQTHCWYKKKNESIYNSVLAFSKKQKVFWIGLDSSVFWCRLCPIVDHYHEISSRHFRSMVAESENKVTAESGVARKHMEGKRGEQGARRGWGMEGMLGTLLASSHMTMLWVHGISVWLTGFMLNRTRMLWDDSNGVKGVMLFGSFGSFCVSCGVKTSFGFICRKLSWVSWKCRWNGLSVLQQSRHLLCGKPAR